LPHPAYIARFAPFDESGNATARISHENPSRARLTGLEEHILQFRQESALGLSLAGN
jgi:hypothetical protein